MDTELSATPKSTEGSIFLATLRESTLPAHKSLEALPISEAIVSPELTIAVYTKYLLLMSSVISDIEENTFPLVSGILPDLDKRRKALLIEADLRELRAGIPANDIEPMRPGSEPSAAFSLGMMYVIEGSTLGGRVILKHAEKALGEDIGGATKYFSGYGAETGSSWKSFLEHFTNYAVAHKDKQEEIIAGADFAFSAIGRHLQQNP